MNWNMQKKWNYFENLRRKNTKIFDFFEKKVKIQKSEILKIWTRKNMIFEKSRFFDFRFFNEFSIFSGKSFVFLKKIRFFFENFFFESRLQMNISRDLSGRFHFFCILKSYASPLSIEHVFSNFGGDRVFRFLRSIFVLFF